MDVSPLLTMDYANKCDWTPGENKPKQSQFENGSQKTAFGPLFSVLCPLSSVVHDAYSLTGCAIIKNLEDCTMNKPEKKFSCG